MDYSKLVAVTALPGLFELINSKTDGGIVRSLDDNATRFVSSRIHSFSHLESIEVYTVRDNVNLVDIFHAMEKRGDKLPDEKDAAAVKKYFEKVYPDLDFERVYSNDLKKMVKWFSVLKKHNIEIKLSEIPEEPEMENSPATVPTEEKPLAKEKTKPAAAKKAVLIEEKPLVKEKTKPAAAKKAAPAESGKKEVTGKPSKKKSTGKKK